MFRLPLSVASPSGRLGRLSILIFHRVLAEPDALFSETPTAPEFERRMRWVKDWFNVLPLAEAIDLLFAGRIPSRALAISFDDGYADNEELAAPILRRLGLTATVFVATSFLDGGCMWNDKVIEAFRRCEAGQLDLRSLGLALHSLDSIAARRAAIDAVLDRIKHLDPQERLRLTEAIVQAAGCKPSPQLMMRSDQVRNLRSLGMEVGAHTVTHPILTRLDAASARDEIGRGKRELETIVDAPVRLFAYPNGVPDVDYGSAHATLVRECGFSAAVSTSWGAASMRSDRFQLPRFTPWDGTRPRFGARMLANLIRAEKLAA
jgi:peptidoglycan/xylan/chitin deacetylase (PgdA/CDA1 family)